MIDHHGEGIASYGLPEKKASIGPDEGLNHKIRILYRLPTTPATRTALNSKPSPRSYRR